MRYLVRCDNIRSHNKPLTYDSMNKSSGEFNNTFRLLLVARCRYRCRCCCFFSFLCEQMKLFESCSRSSCMRLGCNINGNHFDMKWKSNPNSHPFRTRISCVGKNPFGLLFVVLFSHLFGARRNCCKPRSHMLENFLSI